MLSPVVHHGLLHWLPNRVQALRRDGHLPAVHAQGASASIDDVAFELRDIVDPQSVDRGENDGVDAGVLRRTVFAIERRGEARGKIRVVGKVLVRATDEAVIAAAAGQAVVAGAAASRYLWTKWLTRTLASIGVTWLAVALAIAVGERSWTAETSITFVGWGVVLSAYVFFWASLALACNVGRGNSERHAAVLAAAWLALVILLPAAINLLVTNVFPAPSRVELAAQLREATEAADRAAAKDRDRWFFDHPDLRSGEAERAAYYRSVAASERVITDAITPQLSAFESRAAERRALTRRLQWQIGRAHV